MKTIDTRGYSCPEPVIMTKNAIAGGTPLQVLVDNEPPLQNVTRFAVNAGYKVSHKAVGDDYEITIE